jgi:epoxyqueuosine reductase
MSMSLTDDLARHARNQGVDLLGCTSARPFVVGPQQRRFDPRQAMPAARAVVAAACYTYGFERPEPSRPGRPRGRFGPWTRASLAAAGHAQRVVTDFLRSRGFQADSPEDTPLKMVAVRSGIAQYGKNCIVHAAGFGSYLKFAAVVTDADLDCRDVPVETSDCGDCTACQAACPTGALAEPFRLNRPRCVTAWLWGSPIPPDDRRHVGDYIFRCGRCQDACPKNRALTPRRDFPFPLEDKPDTPELIPLLLGDEAYLRATLPEFVLLAGPDAIRRNIAIALGNLADSAATPALARALTLPHAETRAVAAWALGRMGGPEGRAALEAALSAEQDAQVRQEIADALVEIAGRPVGPD